MKHGDVIFKTFQTPVLPFSPVDPLACMKALRANVSVMIWPQEELAKLNGIRDKGVPNKHVKNKGNVLITGSESINVTMYTYENPRQCTSLNCVCPQS